MSTIHKPHAIQSIVRGLHHVAIAVRSLSEARATYELALGMVAGEPEHVPDQKVNVLVLYAGEQRVELVEPAAPDSPISKFLTERGEGLHHVAWRVDDLSAAIAHLLSHRVRMIDEQPRHGAHDTKIAFVHPKSTGGVLMELVEEPRKPR